MRRHWAVLGLLAGGLALLASLYMPWQEASCGPGCDVTRLLNLFSGNPSVDGWSSGIGDAAAVAALLLAGGAAIALGRPSLAGRMPLGLCALTVGYLAFAVAAQARSIARLREVAMNGTDFHYTYGAYVGVAGGAVALLAAAWLRRDELVRDRSPSGIVALVLGVGLLVSLLLPWQRVLTPQVVTLPGIGSPAGVLAAVTGCTAAVLWTRESTARVRLGISAATALFAGAAVSAVAFGVARTYGAWVGLGLGLALVALALLHGAPVVRPTRPPAHAVAAGAAAGLLLTALFLPWQKVCFPAESGVRQCLSTNGWVTIAGSAAGALAILLVVEAVALRRLGVSDVELGVGVGLLVATLGLELAAPDIAGIQLGYGSFIGFSAAALLLVVVLARLRLPRIDRNRLRVRLAPITACLAYLAVVVVPWWDVLPRRLQSHSLVRFAPPSWVTVAGVLLAIHLLGAWMRRLADPRESGDRVVILPLGLLALAAVDLIRLRDAGITWGGGIVVGLCLVLALLGRIDEREGLENFRLPEVLRVDRL
jgi:hypothetical protein